MSASTDRPPTRPINWALTVTVFFAGSVLLWADRTNFSVAAAAWAKDYGWTPSTIGTMLSAFSLGYLISTRFCWHRVIRQGCRSRRLTGIESRRPTVFVSRSRKVK